MGGEPSTENSDVKLSRKAKHCSAFIFGCLEDNKEKSWPTASNYKVIQEVFQ